MVKYELRKIFTDEKDEIQVTSVEFKDYELDHMLFAVEDYYAEVMEDKTLDKDLNEQFESEISGIMFKLGHL